MTVVDMGRLTMHRSSDSIANLAAALAKAQAELVNPEKSLQATIHSDRREGVDQTFRYAPCQAASISCARP